MTTASLISVVDDDDDVRDSIRELLDSAGHAVKIYASAAAFLRDDGFVPRCLIADIRMPDMDGMELLAEFLKRGTGAAVVMLTGHGDLSLAVRAMKAGAVDFIEKPFDDHDFLARIERALLLGKRARGDRDAICSARKKVALLTPREGHVLDKLIAGRSNKLAAYELGISPRTIEIHRAHIMSKMEVRSMSDLVRITLTAQQSLSPPG